MNNSEIWKAIPSFEGLYEVSNTGKVRRACETKEKKKGELLVQTTEKLGYMIVTLFNKSKGTKKHHKVHRLVMLAFIGSSDQDVNHKDGNKTNNHLSNLEYCTRSQNVLHGFRVLGRSFRGEKHPQAKLTDIDIHHIFAMRKQGATYVSIANQFKISSKTISNILNGHTWTHITRNFREVQP